MCIYIYIYFPLNNKSQGEGKCYKVAYTYDTKPSKLWMEISNMYQT